MLGSGYPLFGVFVSTLYFALLVLWIILVFHLMMDIFRSHDLSGTVKAAWVLFIFMLPLIGCLIYLITRGGSMHERQIQQAQAQLKAFEDYIRKVANTKE